MKERGLEGMDDRNDLPEGASEGTQDPANEATSAAEAMARFFGSAAQVLEKYTHCGICGSLLHFTHLTDFSRNLTQESAKCPECGIQARRVLHKLQ
jgi:hypothetical protein